MPKGRKRIADARQEAHVEPFYQHRRPTGNAVESLSKGPSLPVNRNKTAVERDILESKRITKVPMGVGFDEPLEDGMKVLSRLKGFKQAKPMTIEMASWKHNPVVQDMDEAWGRFTGQEQQ